MRNISNIFSESISKLQPVTYLFEITLSENTSLLLTSASKHVEYQSQLFAPTSGISVKECFFDDSAQNYIILTGIFEEGGIDKTTDVLGARVKIIIYSDNIFEHLVTYNCNNYTKSDLDFLMRLEPESQKYNQSIVQSFSKTCRANFGDKRCSVNKMHHIYQYKIENIVGKIITVSGMDKENGYFTGGDVLLSQQNASFKILNHFRGTIEVDGLVPDKLKDSYLVSLISGCDKKFISCCNKFDNAVNFRGEPFIPDHNFLKIGIFE